MRGSDITLRPVGQISFLRFTINVILKLFEQIKLNPHCAKRRNNTEFQSEPLSQIRQPLAREIVVEPLTAGVNKNMTTCQNWPDLVGDKWRALFEAYWIRCGLLDTYVACWGRNAHRMRRHCLRIGLFCR